MIALDSGIASVLAALIAGGTGLGVAVLAGRPARRAARESASTRRHVENGAQTTRAQFGQVVTSIEELDKRFSSQIESIDRRLSRIEGMRDTATILREAHTPDDELGV